MERSGCTLEVRAEGEGDSAVIVGHGVPFDQEVDLFGDGQLFEVIRSGAFSRSISDAANDISSMVDHDRKRLIGRRSNARLEVSEDSVGVFYRARPDLSKASMQEAIADIRSRNMPGSSIQFSLEAGGAVYSKRADGGILREVMEANLHEIGPTPFPVYSGSSAGLAARSKPWAGQFVEMRSRGLTDDEIIASLCETATEQLDRQQREHEERSRELQLLRAS